VTGARTLIVSFDAELDGDFQRAFSEGLDALAIPHADAGAIDADPESPQTIDIYIVSASRGGTGAYDLPDVVRIIGGPGGRETGGRAMRLEAADIREGTKRWAAVAGRIGELAGRPGLEAYVLAASGEARLAWAAEHALDPLAADILESRKSAVLMGQLEAATRRAEAAETALAQAQRDAAVETVDRRRAQSSAAATHARVVELEAELARLRTRLEDGPFALSLAPDGKRDVIDRARDAAAMARMAAARGAAAAEAYPGALVWPQGDAAYAGETRNRHPHGPGVMTFARTGCFYRGDFVGGSREGFGIGRSEDGSIWSGRWSKGEACGYGILETADGRRFEGEVAPGDRGPRRVDGYVWPATAGARKAQRDPMPLKVEPSYRALPAK